MAELRFSYIACVVAAAQVFALVLLAIGMFVAMYYEEPTSAALKCLERPGDFFAYNGEVRLLS